LTPTNAHLGPDLSIFCMDISGSMGVTQEVSDIQGEWNNLKMKYTGNRAAQVFFFFLLFSSFFFFFFPSKPSMNIGSNKTYF